MNISKNIQFAKCCAAIMLLASCTGSFEDYNTNPYGVTQEEMRGDNAGAGSNLQGMIPVLVQGQQNASQMVDRKSTRLNSSHANISYAVFCLKKKKHIRRFIY